MVKYLWQDILLLATDNGRRFVCTLAERRNKRQRYGEASQGVMPVSEMQLFILLLILIVLKQK